MNDDIPTLAELFLHVVLFVLPRDSFVSDRPALLRLAQVQKNLVEQMKLSSGGFTLDLHMSAKDIVMISPYPCCNLAFFSREHFQALKNAAARFQSIDKLSINLKCLPTGCNFINTQQILDLVFHCLSIGHAKKLSIKDAIFEADQFTNKMQNLTEETKNRILLLELSKCRLAIDTKFLRQLASMSNLRHLTLDGNMFHLAHSGLPAFSDHLEYLSVANCCGIRPTILKNVKKTLQTLVWNDNVILDEDKPVFLEWLKDSRLRSLDMDNCGFHADDVVEFQKAFESMPCLLSLSVAHNDFQDSVFWWLYNIWRTGHIRTFFSVHISNMHVCFPDSGYPVLLSNTRFGYIEIQGQGSNVFF